MSTRDRARCISIAFVVACLVGSFTLTTGAQVAVRGATIHTMSGPPITEGVVVITDGTIAAVGPADEVDIPDGYTVLEAEVVTPGLIDAYGTVGLTGIDNQPHDQDQIERSAPLQPELRAMDAYNAHEELVSYLRGFGVTTVHTGHAPGELITGQTMVVKTVGNTVEEAMLVDVAAVIGTLGPAANRSEGSPGTRSKQMAMLRQELIKAREYLERRERGEEIDPEHDAEAAESSDEDVDETGERRRSRGRDLRLEALGRVLHGELPLLVTANKLRKTIFEEFPPARHEALRQRYLPGDAADGRPFSF